MVQVSGPPWAVVAISFYLIAVPGVLGASAPPAFSNGSLKGSYRYRIRRGSGFPHAKMEIVLQLVFYHTKSDTVAMRVQRTLSRFLNYPKK